MTPPPPLPPREILLASSPESPITAYDPLTGTKLAHFSGSSPPRKGLALVGSTLIASSHISAATVSGSIRLHSWLSSAAPHCIPLPEPVLPITATPTGSYLFSGGLSGQIHVLSLPSGDLCSSFRAHCKPVSCLVTSDDGSLLISGGDDGVIAVFSIIQLLDVSAVEDDDDPNSTHLALYQVSAHELPVTALAVGVGGCTSIVVSSSLDCTCKFWSIPGGTRLRTVQFPCAIWCIVLDATDSELYAGGSDGRVYSVHLKTRGRMAAAAAGVVAWVPPEQGGAVTTVAMTNWNQNLASASEDGIISIWDVESGEVVRVVKHEQGSISDIVVAKVVDRGSGTQTNNRGDVNYRQNLGFSVREMCLPVREVMEMEDWLDVVGKDRKRAVDMLEETIGTYERLLRLILKEVKGGNNKIEAKEQDPSL